MVSLLLNNRNGMAVSAYDAIPISNKTGEKTMKMQKAMTILSYMSLLLLIMPSTLSGVISVMILFAIGLALMVLKNLWPEYNKNSKYYVLAAVVFVTYLGCRFYNQWLTSSKVGALSAALRISPAVPIIVAAVCLSLAAVYFLVNLLQRITKALTTANEKRFFQVDLLRCLIAAIITVFLSQIMVEVDIFSMGLPKLFGGILIVFTVILTLYGLTGAMRASIVLGSGLFMILSVANTYIYSFRGRLLEPADMFSLGTAMNVADNYSIFPIPFSIIISCVIWCGLLIFFFCTKAKSKPSWKKQVVVLLCCVIGFFSVFCYTADLKTYNWKREGAAFNGYILNFVAKIKEMYITQPDGYSEERIAELSDQYKRNPDSSESEEERPHILVIMDEAFSDLNVIGEISTDTDVMPFISSLKDDVVSGYALASVYGGNTANSEFEFLTGNSMAWLSPNVVPYQQYIHSSSYSMVSYLKTYYGYQCIAMHPFLSTGWNRPDAYKHLGFDESFFVEDFPQEDYIREYISDREMFEKLVDTYETRHQDPLFLFGVSMQNHGAYLYAGENYTQSVSLVGYDNDYPDVEQYLSLLHETDKAVEYLISYFSSVDDEVIIVFFGDHQPKIDEAFYNEVGENASNSLDAQQTRYMVPFFIWSNYDIDEKYVECTSLNYLSSYVYEVAGITLPAYNQFLSEMEETIPAINANGFYSLASQCYLPFDMASEEERTWLEAYEQLQYNNLFGEKHRNDDLFPVLE